MDLRRVSRLVAGILLVGVAVFFLLRVGGTEEPPVAAPDPAVTSPSVPKTDLPPKKDPGCAGGTDAEFRPASIAVPGVVRRAAVLALPRDDRNVPGVPPLSDKASFAWDDGGIRPGSAQGNVLMNTHTWPDGSATGNLLLEHLEVGDRIVLRGEGEKLCYEITERIEARFSRLFEREVATLLVTTGTPANSLSHSAAVPPYGSARCQARRATTG
jgi:hypothetical protein